MFDQPEKNCEAAVDDGGAGWLARLIQFSVIGLFAIAALAVLKLAAEVMVPIVAAILVGSILARWAERLSGLGAPSAAANTFVIICAVAVGLLLIAGLVEPFTRMLARAPDMAQAVSEMSAPLARRWENLKSALGASSGGAEFGDAMGWITAFLGRLTPALQQMLVFFPCLAFFVAGRSKIRRQMVLAMPERASRLSTLRVIVSVERALSVYFATTVLVYSGVGAVTGVIAAGFGLSNPLLWAAMTFAAGYLPYIGVALITLALSIAGLLAFPHSLFALVPASLYFAVHIFSEMAIMPMLLGRRHEVNPFLIFLSIVFWSWMWGPVGAILAVPLLLTAQTLIEALSEPEKGLP
jgi:predicted PurR-regulated permease PerM